MLFKQPGPLLNNLANYSGFPFIPNVLSPNRPNGLGTIRVMVEPYATSRYGNLALVDIKAEKKITIVFQPHTYSRTQELFGDFADALSLADSIILLPIYAAREENTYGVTHVQLSDAIKGKNRNVRAFDSFNDAVSNIKSYASDKDLILVMGAGDVTKIADSLTIT